MNVPVNLDHTQVERLLLLLNPDLDHDYEPDGDALIVDKLTRAKDLAVAQEEERRATSARIAAEHRASMIASAVDAAPLLDRIEQELNEGHGVERSRRTQNGAIWTSDLKRILRDIRESVDEAKLSGSTVIDAEETLHRAKDLLKRVLIEVLGVPATSIEGIEL